MHEGEWNELHHASRRVWRRANAASGLRVLQSAGHAWSERTMKVIGAFDPEATAALTAAYRKACQSMHDWGQPDIIKETIAKRILEIASRGEPDPDELCERALKSLGFSESPSIQPMHQQQR
jgi:hypothetical protein